MIKSKPPNLWFISAQIVFLSAAFFAIPAHAIDLQPGEIKAPPPGLNVAMVSYQISDRGDFYASGNVASNATQIKASQLQLRYSHTFLTGALPSVVYVQTPIGYTHPNRALAAAYDNKSGVGDTTLAYAFWPIANHETQRYFGFAGYLTLPTGQYDHSNAPFNMGGNRFSYALQSGFQVPLAPNLNVMAALDGVWFGQNEDFGPAKKTLRQEALYTAQVGLSYDFCERYSLGAAYFYTEGGESSVDHLKRNDTIELQRYQLTASSKFSFGKIVVQYGADLKSQNGFFEDSRLIVRYITLF